jgi:membrane protease YdiL (CAAX protease family)
MSPQHTSLRRILWIYALVCASVFAVSQLESISFLGQYVHLAVAAIFLLTSIRLTASDPSHFGVALGGLLEGPVDDRAVGPFGIFDLGRAIRRALPCAAIELGVALAIAAVAFPIFAVGFYLWNQPVRAFTFTLPPNAASFVLAQLVVVALPEEAFFRGYVQTALSDLEETRLRVLGVRLAPLAWVFQAILFATIHFIVDPHPARLAVFFPALLFGWTRGWRRGIGAALALHAMSNLYSEILTRSWL